MTACGLQPTWKNQKNKVHHTLTTDEVSVNCKGMENFNLEKKIIYNEMAQTLF